MKRNKIIAYMFSCSLVITSSLGSTNALAATECIKNNYEFSIDYSDSESGHIANNDNRDIEVTETIENSAISDLKYEVNIDDEINKAINGKTDLNIDMAKYFSISCSDSDTTETNIYSTTSKLINNDYELNGSFERYATTVLAQRRYAHDSDVRTSYNVTVWITIYWIDEFGPSNYLESVEGGWSVSPGNSVSFSNRELRTRGWDDASHYSAWVTNSPTSNSYTYGVGSLLPSNLPYFSFEAVSSVVLNNDINNPLTFNVSTGLFDPSC